MISAGLYHELTKLFSDMSLVTFFAVIVGLILITVEFFQPSHGVFTACGAAFCLLGITVRMLGGGSTVMLFYMVYGCSAVIVAAHIYMLVRHKKLWLTASLALKLKRSVIEELADDNGLIGHEGVATTDINGSGHMALDDVNFFVQSDEVILKGSRVKVVSVSGSSIKVIKSSPSGDGSTEA